jgi:acetyltransferase-like isoleucine patch superfamily enzyme
VVVGRNSIIGAGAVVVEDVDDEVTVAGNPAKEVGRRGRPDSVD